MSLCQNKKQPKIGDIFYMNFSGSGSEQNGWRPGLVFQNNIGNIYSPNIIALPLTSSLKKIDQPTHVVLPAIETGLRLDSMVLCENPERMSKDRIGDYIVTISDDYMKLIAKASLLATSAISFVDLELLTAIWHEAIKLNSR